MHHKDLYKLSYQIGSLGMYRIIFPRIHMQTRNQLWLMALLFNSQIKNYICYLLKN